MDNFSGLLSIFVVLMSVYSLTATSGILSERSGIVNLSLNGYLMIGALGAIMAHSWFGSGFHEFTFGINGKVGIDFGALFIGMLFAIVTSILFSLGTINLRGNHVIVGTAMNLLVASLVFIVRFLDSNKEQPHFTDTNYNGIVAINTVKSGFNYSALLYLSIALFICGTIWFVIRYTKFGLRLWASGENPNALAAAGVNVYLVRWATQFIVAALSGLAGGIFIIYSQWSYGVAFRGNVEGIGFIALSFVVLSQWRIQFVFPIAIAFGFLQAWLTVNKFHFEHKSPGFDYLMEMIPFAVPIIVLPLFKRFSNIPKHDGLIYDPSKR